MTPELAHQMLRENAGKHTVWLIDRGLGPELTTSIPCGRTAAYSMGRYTPDAIPTLAEVEADLMYGLQQLKRLTNRRAA